MGQGGQEGPVNHLLVLVQHRLQAETFVQRAVWSVGRSVSRAGKPHSVWADNRRP